ncbi:MAG: thioredoxin [Spirochaetia bacterium]|nr:thioredoxin [Spirochaetia bacterium]
MTVARKTGIRIIVSLLIVVIVSGLWVLKQQQEATLREENTSTRAVGIPMNPDFTLDVQSPIDLERLKSYKIPILIDFGADTCIPCKEMAPVLEDLNSRLQGKAIIRFVDVGKYPDLATAYPVRVIPTQLLIDSDGRPYTPSAASKLQILMYTDKEGGDHTLSTHEGGMTEAMLLQVLGEMGLSL